MYGSKDTQSSSMDLTLHHHSFFPSRMARILPPATSVAAFNPEGKRILNFSPKPVSPHPIKEKRTVII